ncbi:MAG: hypothetical protein SPJ62_17055 [Inconstantimicrobium porci]|uniref:hypothetical protein n=1 Tax=Inconstantimicrobium porci TaxID=2652291 RepID=UPI002A914BA5|nr:hypothetical protein [Inconstantimicrobium porci]MDY5913673.1 hypothetical protein [Inconstantimicrobium porci]
MKRYINPQSNYNVGSDCFYDDSLPVIEFTESLADASHFVPVTDLTSVTGNITNTSLFDFPDGKDTGISRGRADSHRDLAERFVEARNAIDVHSSNVAKMKEDVAYNKSLNEIVNSKSASNTDSISGGNT